MRKDSTYVIAGDQMVNLQNVSSVKVIEEELRIVFNMNYPIALKVGGTLKKISDYVYWDCSGSEELAFSLSDILVSEYFRENFLTQIGNCFVNKNEIGSIKLDNDKMRIIFNLSHPVAFRGQNARCTSEFVYVDCKDQEEYKLYVDYLKRSIL